MRIALAQINPTVGDFAGNSQKIIEFAARAASQGAELVMFPELAICGYPPADLLEKKDFLDSAGAALAGIAAWTAERGRPAILCGTIMPLKSVIGKHVRNVAALLHGGKIAFTQQKMLLPFYDVFDEQRYFEPASHQALTSVGGETLAITICEDAWNDKGFWPRRLYPTDPVEELMRQWDDAPPGFHRVILNISASPFWRGKRTVRRDMLSALAKRHNAFVAMVNQVGGNDSLIFDGTSIVIGPDGSVVAQAASFFEDIILFDTASATGEVRFGDGVSGVVPPAGSGATFGEGAGSQGNVDDEISAMWDALVLGTRDYVRKCGFSKALVALSGGIDSALVAAIAVEALGPENVMGIGMPSEYSSTGSVDDARSLAQNLGIKFELLAIHDVFNQCESILAPLFAGTKFGLAEENLQSRIRGSLLMTISNKFGALVLTTGNKSEMSTGYCTLYGDMVGALAVIGDVMKTKVYALSRYANRQREIIPLSTIEKPPSAELRPDQKDTDSLPPYEVLDPILEAYVERYCSAEQIARDQGVDVALVRSVLQLVERCEYKRQQAAPVLKVTPKSFGLGRRFPIAAKVQI
ncbi:NAD+ synthase (glutamine-hydrolyzing) [Granulicella aggregans]|uniref:Glutamine-dependent NAD(+) synthetase n=1 Tax=Granulicella aggregans TaxID=474949 RepID=A0A7W7ZFI9_9BACT|nr:NAD+ synthase (glutamine-hydrolyzing) [Granulicella aggregans]